VKRLFILQHPSLNGYVNTFKEAIRLFPSSTAPYIKLARQYDKMGKSDLATETLEKGLKIKETPAYIEKIEKDKNVEKIKK
jgi:Tfp pilus assembly protein PilF